MKLTAIYRKTRKDPLQVNVTNDYSSKKELVNYLRHEVGYRVRFILTDEEVKTISEKSEEAPILRKYHVAVPIVSNQNWDKELLKRLKKLGTKQLEKRSGLKDQSREAMIKHIMNTVA